MARNKKVDERPWITRIKDDNHPLQIVAHIWYGLVLAIIALLFLLFIVRAWECAS